MPRGKPNLGFRKTEAWSQRTGQPKVDYSAPIQKPAIPIFNNAFVTPVIPSDPTENLTDEQVLERINGRFEVLDIMIDEMLAGEADAIVVSGPAGCGKSHLVESKLSSWNPDGDRYIFVKGTVRPTGLFSTLYDYREKGNVVVFDDADSVFDDIQSLNFLKAVCDTSKKRIVSYLSQVDLTSEKTGEAVPKSFEFQGSVIFISNYDFDSMISGRSKLSPHLQALMSRSHYIDLSMHSTRGKFIRIKDVVTKGMLSGLNKDQIKEVLDFIYENKDKMRELSLRSALKIGGLRKSKKNWQHLATVTCCKN